MGKSASRVNLTETTSKTSKKVGTKNATVVQLNDTEERNRKRRSKQATRISLENANNDLADEVISLRDRVDTLEREKNEQLNDDDISLLKASITQLEFCIIENFGEDMSQILPLLQEIKTRIEGLEASATSLTNQNNDILTACANLSTQIENSAGGKPKLELLPTTHQLYAVGYQKQYQDSTSYFGFASYNRSAGSPTTTYPATGNTPIGLGYRYGRYNNNVYKYYTRSLGFLRFNFPVTQEIIDNWAGIQTITLRQCFYNSNANTTFYVCKTSDVYSVPSGFSPGGTGLVTKNERLPWTTGTLIPPIDSKIVAPTGHSFVDFVIPKNTFTVDENTTTLSLCVTANQGNNYIISQQRPYPYSNEWQDSYYQTMAAGYHTQANPNIDEKTKLIFSFDAPSGN